MNKRGIVTILLIFGGLFLVLFAFLAVLVTALKPDMWATDGERLGVVEVTGPIMDSKQTLKDLQHFAKDDSIPGILVRVDSPGGAVAPSQEIFEAIKRIKAKKPVVVSMGSTAASGGYYIACAADTIFASPGSVTGSIGVITQLFNVSGILESVDVKVNTIKTGPYKDSGSPFRDFSAEDESYFNQLIEDIYEQFVEDVAASRKLEVDAVRQVADGRVFTGRQALELKLVDQLGGVEQATEFLAEKVGFKGEPELVYPPRDKGGVLAELLTSGMESTMDSALQRVRSETTPRVQYLYTGPQ